MSLDDEIYLQQRDKDKLERSLQRQYALPIARTQQKDLGLADQNTDTYIAVPPCGLGIPARVGNIPGSQVCCIFRLQEVTTTTTTGSGTTTTLAPCISSQPAPCYCFWTWNGTDWVFKEGCLDNLANTCGNNCNCSKPTAPGAIPGQVSGPQPCYSLANWQPPPPATFGIVPVVYPDGDQLKEDVYNIYDFPVPPLLPPNEKYIRIHRDKYGKWECEPWPGGTSTPDFVCGSCNPVASTQPSYLVSFKGVSGNFPFSCGQCSLLDSIPFLVVQDADQPCVYHGSTPISCETGVANWNIDLVVSNGNPITWTVKLSDAGGSGEEHTWSIAKGNSCDVSQVQSIYTGLYGVVANFVSQNTNPQCDSSQTVAFIQQGPITLTPPSTTTTPAPALPKPTPFNSPICAGQCKWIWSSSNRSWSVSGTHCSTTTSTTGVPTTTSTPTTTTPVPTTTSAPTSSTSSTTTTPYPCLCPTTSTSSTSSTTSGPTTTTTPAPTTTTTTTPVPCDCIYPSFCGIQDGDCTYTLCSNLFSYPPSCPVPCDCTTTTSTTGVPTTSTSTTPCPICNPPCKCVWIVTAGPAGAEACYSAHLVYSDCNYSSCQCSCHSPVPDPVCLQELDQLFHINFPYTIPPTASNGGLGCNNPFLQVPCIYPCVCCSNSINDNPNELPCCGPGAVTPVGTRITNSCTGVTFPPGYLGTPISPPNTYCLILSGGGSGGGGWGGGLPIIPGPGIPSTCNGNCQWLWMGNYWSLSANGCYGQYIDQSSPAACCPTPPPFPGASTTPAPFVIGASAPTCNCAYPPYVGYGVPNLLPSCDPCGPGGGISSGSGNNLGSVSVQTKCGVPSGPTTTPAPVSCCPTTLPPGSCGNPCTYKWDVTSGKWIQITNSCASSCSCSAPSDAGQDSCHVAVQPCCPTTSTTSTSTTTTTTTTSTTTTSTTSTTTSTTTTTPCPCGACKCSLQCTQEANNVYVWKLLGGGCTCVGPAPCTGGCSCATCFACNSFNVGQIVTNISCQAVVTTCPPTTTSSSTTTTAGLITTTSSTTTSSTTTTTSTTTSSTTTTAGLITSTSTTTSTSSTTTTTCTPPVAGATPNCNFGCWCSWQWNGTSWSQLTTCNGASGQTGTCCDAFIGCHYTQCGISGPCANCPPPPMNGTTNGQMYWSLCTQ